MNSQTVACVVQGRDFQRAQETLIACQYSTEGWIMLDAYRLSDTILCK